jgi:hypothetical protein
VEARALEVDALRLSLGYDCEAGGSRFASQSASRSWGHAGEPGVESEELEPLPAYVWLDFGTGRLRHASRLGESLGRVVPARSSSSRTVVRKTSGANGFSRNGTDGLGAPR